MSSRRPPPRCLKLGNANVVLCAREFLSSSLPSSGEMQMIKSICFIQFFACKNRVWLPTKPVLRQLFALRRCKTHPKHICTRLDGRDKPLTYLGPHLEAYCRLHILDQTFSYANKYRGFYSHMNYLRNHFTTVTTITSRGEFVWKISAGTNSASIAQVHTWEKWNQFLCPPLQLEAAP